MAYLDIMPIARGHVLVATRAHRQKLSDVSVEESRELGVWVRVVSRAVMRALGMEGEEGGDWNVVQNNGAWGRFCFVYRRDWKKRERFGQDAEKSSKSGVHACVC